MRNFMYFLRIVGRRFGDDRCLLVAAALSYTTMLALVPLLTIGVSIFSAFPIFETFRDQAQTFMLSNLAPGVGETVHEYFAAFLDNTGSLTITGMIFLIITALMLLSTIEGAFNDIWRVEKRRSGTVRILAYWTVLTLGPMLFGGGLWLSNWILTAASSTGDAYFGGQIPGIQLVLPFFVEAISFTFFYMVLPNRSIYWRHAVAGGALAALLFEGLKLGFGGYLQYFAGYQVIYGALASIPVILIWMYLAWAVVLVGAIFAASFIELADREHELI